MATAAHRRRASRQDRRGQGDLEAATADGACPAARRDRLVPRVRVPPPPPTVEVLVDPADLVARVGPAAQVVLVAAVVPPPVRHSHPPHLGCP